jgi:hypothetical protein
MGYLARPGASGRRLALAKNNASPLNRENQGPFVLKAEEQASISSFAKVATWNLLRFTAWKTLLFLSFQIFH